MSGDNIPALHVSKTDVDNAARSVAYYVSHSHIDIIRICSKAAAEATGLKPADLVIPPEDARYVAYWAHYNKVMQFIVARTLEKLKRGEM